MEHIMPTIAKTPSPFRKIVETKAAPMKIEAFKYLVFSGDNLYNTNIVAIVVSLITQLNQDPTNGSFAINVITSTAHCT